jgi:hypothetical protein
VIAARIASHLTPRSWWVRSIRHPTTTDDAGSSSRTREGGKAGFYATKARVDADGFRSAIELAAARGAVAPTAIPELWVGFHVRLAATMAREGRLALALEQMGAARAVSVEATERRLAASGWSNEPWTRTDR